MLLLRATVFLLGLVPVVAAINSVINTVVLPRSAPDAIAHRGLPVRPVVL